MAEQAAAGILGVERHPPEAVSVDPADAVVPRQPFVDERVVRAQQLEEAPVLAEGALDEQLGLAAECLAQVLVELGIVGRLALLGIEVAQTQPLAREVVDERLRAGVGEQPAGLPLQFRRLVEPPVGRRLQQLVVRDAAPQEERQPRRQLEAAEAVGRVGRRVRGVALDAEQELGVDQHPFQRELDAGVEAAVAPAGAEEAEQGRDVFLGGGPAIRPAGQPGEDPAGAGRLFVGRGRRRRPADEDLAAARGIAGAVDGVGAADRHLLHRRVVVVPFIDEAAVAPVARLQRPLLLRRPPHEGHAHEPLARPRAEARLEAGVPRVHVVLPLGIPGDVPREAQRGHLPHRLGVADLEPLDERAVHAHVELLRRRETEDVVGEVPVEADADRVLAVDREIVPDRDAAAGAERQAVVLPVVLQPAGMHPPGRDGGPYGGNADGQPADAAGGREVARHQVGRHREQVAVVVETVLVGVVRRQQRVDVDVDREQIADGGAVLGPVEAVERLAAARVGAGQGRRVDLRLEPRGDSAVRGVVRPRAARRRHRPRPELDDHPLPRLGVGADMRQVAGVEGQPGREQALVVAAHAELVERCADRLPGGGRRGRARLRGGDRRPAEGGQHAAQDHQHSDHRTGSGHQRLPAPIMIPDADARHRAIPSQLHPRPPADRRRRTRGAP